MPFNRTNDGAQIERMKQIVEEVGFDPEYHTAISNSFSPLYDFYRPDSIKTKNANRACRTQRYMAELSQVSSIVDAISGKVRGDERPISSRNGQRRNAKRPLSWTTHAEFQNIAAQLMCVF